MSIRAESSEEMTQVLSTTSAATMSTTTMPLWALANSYWAFDDFAMLDEDGEPIVAYTYTVNDANELTAMSDGTTTTNFTYDAWGRQVSKYTGGSSATYEYRYSHKLASVSSNFPGEGAVDYLYGGDGKRRARTAGVEETWYNWDGRYMVLSQEDDASGIGDLCYTLIGRSLAYIEGSAPNGNNVHLNLSDRLGSPAMTFDMAKLTLSTQHFDSFGVVLSHSGAANVRAYSGYDWDTTSQMYYAPFRHYNPTMARWISRDPMGMIDSTNIYTYVLLNPINLNDHLGLDCTDWLDGLQTGLDIAGLIPGFGEVADGVNAVVSVGRRNYGDAALSVGAMVPFVGWASTGAKVVKRAKKFEILDGVRRAKANQLVGNSTIPALVDEGGKLTGPEDLPINTLLSPKTTINYTEQPDRWNDVWTGVNSGAQLPPITVTPGTCGIPIAEVNFD